MAITYKEVEYNFSGYDKQTYNKRQTFEETDEGISSVQFRSESLNFNDSAGPISHTISGSHYNFIQGLYFDSSSFYDYPKIYKNKLHNSGSVIYIPQQYYGEEIKPNTFRLIDNHSSQEINIVDDGNGNLYSTNAINSSSAASSISSSENYVGNIQYQMGVVTITETGAWSGSGAESTDIMYTDVSTDKFILKFNATHTIYTNQVVAKIDKTEFNLTTNQSVFSGSTGKINSNITSSVNDWHPYATSIQFYEKAPVRTYTGGSPIDSYDINPGFSNHIEWLGGDIDDINTINIPSAIQRITYVNENNITILTSRDQNGGVIWEGELNILKQNRQLQVKSEATTPIQWVIDTPTLISSPQTPLLVANFPKPVKIDKNSDLTIIIRYDT